MKSENFKWYSHRDCEFFPCHEGADPDSFNCLFCYCPLYALGDRCGGHFTYDDDGIKDCSGCLIPHSTGGYDYIAERFAEIAGLAAEKRGK